MFKNSINTHSLFSFFDSKFTIVLDIKKNIVDDMMFDLTYVFDIDLDNEAEESHSAVKLCAML